MLVLTASTQLRNASKNKERSGTKNTNSPITADQIIRKSMKVEKPEQSTAKLHNKKVAGN